MKPNLENSITHSDRARTIIDTNNKARTVKINEDGSVMTRGSYSQNIPADYYLYQTIATVVLSSHSEIGDDTINVVSSSGVILGHVITFYEGNNMFQSIVTAKTDTTISVASLIDFAYTEDALIEAGLWSMNVDGSTTTQVFSIKAPPTASICIHTINCSMLDSSDMDDGMFGGLPALTNGILFRFVNSIVKNLAVILNNIGFWEIGFTTEYSEKAPAGQYGFKARRNIPKIDGVVVYLAAGGSSEFKIYIRDDLTDLDLFACIINGHIHNN